MVMINMWGGPFADFPREMGFPFRSVLVYNLQEFLEKANKYNGKANVFTSLYSFNTIKSTGKPDYDSAKITHLFFDLDNGNCFANALKLHKYLLEQNLLHEIFFSGGGFHVYVAAQYPNYLQNKKATIFNAAVDISDKVGLKIGINEHSDIDAHALGNIAQLVRVPNTYNLKRKKFCIPILSEDLNDPSIDKILLVAQLQRFVNKNIYGENYLDLQPYDGEGVEHFEIPEIMETNSLANVGIVDVEKFAPCVKYLLTEKFIKRHRDRYFILAYLKEIGLSYQDAIFLLKKYLPARTFHHCVHEEKQPLWVYRRADISFPRCDTLRAEGYCKERCTRES